MSQPIILPYNGKMPKIHPTAYIAPGAAIIGDVEIGADSSVWFNVTIRGDVNEIRIGERTNIQDNTAIHCERSTYGTYIGDDVTIGHSAVIHACKVGNGSLIGIQSCILDGAEVEAKAMVAANTLITPGKRVLTGQLWAGSPGKYWRELNDAEKHELVAGNQNYLQLKAEYIK